jgi:alkylation response protein AidB-like acyl-CoA dehydrogenase
MPAINSDQYSIPAEWVQVLGKEAVTAEQAGVLTKAQLDIIHDAHWFRMFLPESLGGLDLSLPEGLLLEETLARIDGSLGWTVTLCSGATMFAGFLEPSLAKQLLTDPQACFGGSGAPDGTADKQGDHYLINGRWKYATGAPHLTAFTANCRLLEHGIPLLGDNGQPLIRAFIFKADEVTIEEDWHTMGLQATAGHTFSVQNLLVSSERAFDIKPEAAHLSSLIFKYPFQPFAETTLAVNTLGMAEHFQDRCEEIFTARATRKSSGTIHYQQLIANAREGLGNLRKSFYDVVNNSWEEHCANGYLSPEQLIAIRKVSVELVVGARHITQELFPYCGMAATNPGSEINRVWRDIFTASQHSLLTEVGE